MSYHTWQNTSCIKDTKAPGGDLNFEGEPESRFPGSTALNLHQLDPKLELIDSLIENAGNICLASIRPALGAFLFGVFCFWRVFLCVELTVLELTLQTRLAELTEIHLPASQVLGKKVCATTAQLFVC